MTKTSRRLAMSLAALVAVGGCRSAVEPDAPVPLEFVFGIHRLQVEPAFLVEDRSANILVRGYLLTPCQPYDATASAQVVGTTLVLRVLGEATGECPQDLVSSVAYQAVLGAVPANYTHLRITHEWRDANWPGITVLEMPLPTSVDTAIGD